MDANIKIKEVNIAKVGQPKMARIGDYWSEQQTTKIVDLLKEYKMYLKETIKTLKVWLRKWEK